MSTKSEGLASIEAKLPTIKARIVDALQQWPGLGREDLSELLDMRLATVCGAVKPLIDAGKLRVAGSYDNPNTGRRVEKLEFVYPPMEK